MQEGERRCEKGEQYCRVRFQQGKEEQEGNLVSTFSNIERAGSFRSTDWRGRGANKGIREGRGSLKGR